MGGIKMNDELYVKKTKLERELNKRNIKYSIEEKDNGKYQIRYTMHGQEVVAVIRLEEKFMNDCYIYFGKLEGNSKKGQILEFINELNDKYRNTKYILSEDTLFLQFIYLSDANSFDAATFIDVVFIELSKLHSAELKQFMKIIWA